MITPLFAEHFDPTPEAPDMGVMDRLAYYAGVAVPQSAIQTANATSQLFYGQNTFGDDFSPPQLPPAQNTGQAVADLAGGLMPYLASVTGVGAATRLIPGMTRLAKVAPMAEKMIRGATAFGLPAAQQGRDVALEQALEGAVLGPIEAIPSRLARIPFTAALGAGSKAFFDYKDPKPVVGDWSAGDIAFAANFLAPLFPRGARPPAPAVPRPPLTNPWASTANLPPEVPPTFYGPGGSRPSTGIGHDPNVAGGPSVDELLGTDYFAKDAAMSAQNMQAAHAERLQQLQSAGLMPFDNSHLSREELKLKQAIHFGHIDPAEQLRSLVDPNAPIRLGNDVGPQPVDPLALATVPDPRIPAARVFDPEWENLGPVQGRTTQPLNMLTELIGPDYARLGLPGYERLPFNEEFAQFKDASAQQQRQQLVELAKWTAGLEDAPNVISPSGDPFEEIIRKGSQPPINPIHDAGRVEARKKLDDLIAERQYILESESGDPYSVGVTGLDKAIGMLRKQLEDGSADPELIRALGFGAIRAGVGATMGGLFADEAGVDPIMAATVGAGSLAFGPMIAKHGIAAIQRLKKFGAFGQGAEGGAIGSHGGMRPAFRLGDGTVISPRDLPLIDRDLQSMQKPNPDIWTGESGGIANPFEGKPMPMDTEQRVINSPPSNVVESGIQNADQVSFAKSFQEKIAAKGEELKARIVPSGLQKGDYFTSVQTGRKYEFLGDAPTAKNGPGKDKPRVYYRDPFDKSEGSMYQEGIVETGGLGKDKGMKKGSKERGFATDELRAALGRTAFGAFTGGSVGAMTDDPGSNDNMARGAVIGGLGMLLGPSAIRLAMEKPKPGTAGIRAMSDTGFDLGNMVAEARLNMFKNADGLSDRVVSRMDRWFGISKDPGLKRMLGDARGATARHIKTIDNSFRELSIYDVDQTVKDATNAFLDGKDTRAQYMAKLGQSIAADPKIQSYANFAINARTAVDGLIEVGARGIGNANRQAMMRASLGKYLRQSYKLFTDPNYQPSEAAVQALTGKILQGNLWNTTDASQITRELRAYAKDIQQQKGVYKPSTSTNHAIDQNLFKHRKVLDAEMKDFLGEITDPIERIHLSVLKLRPLAETSDLMRQLISGTKSAEGLPHLIPDQASLNVEKAKVLQSLQNATGDQIPPLQRKLNELEQYTFIKNSERYGAIKNQLVHRTVADVMNLWDEAAQADSPLTRTMLGINNFMKANVTYRNPLGTIKQIMTAPFFLQIGRANWDMVPEAMRAMRDQSHPAYNELIERGIVGVDSISRDVERELNGISNGMYAAAGSPQGARALLGRLDGQIARVANTVSKGDMKMADWFRLPDNTVRAATYLSAKTRIAKELGLALDDPIVANKAVEFTNRYTMNYEHLPQAVIKGRAVPGMNLFLSYSYEMARILKNLGEDIVHGEKAGGGPGARMNAVMALGFLAALPETVQAVGENRLSDKDKADWQAAKKLLPGYARNRFYFVTGRDPKTKRFNYIDYTSIIPIDAFSQTVRGIANGDAEAARQTNPIASLSNSPIINAWTTLSTRQNIHTNARARNWKDDLANVASEVGGPMTPGTGSIWRDLRQAFSENAEGELGLTNKSGKTLTPADIIPWAVGMKSGSFSLDVQQQKAMAQFKQDVAEEMHYYNDVIKSNLPDAKKDIATQRTKQAIIALKRQLAERLGISPDLDQQ